MHVLDVGSGFEGPARTLAAEFGCQVIGLDLTKECCRTAETLTAWVGLHDRVTFRQGNALDMPFAETTFDVVWTQDVLMNIEEKPRLFAEMHRVLRPGGHLAFQASLAGPVPGVYYPTSWADDARLSFLMSPEECRRLLVASGFQERAWYNTTAPAEARTRLATGSAGAPADSGAPTLGLAIIFATDFEVRMANMRRNYAEGRLGKFMAVFERPV
jgi:ubiquinone/menaquinone biosynthesis C-methylase UbiE